MGNSKKNVSGKFDDDEVRYKKRPKHASNVRGRGMKVLNMYDEDDYEDEVPFKDVAAVSDEIFITHTKA